MTDQEFRPQSVLPIVRHYRWLYANETNNTPQNKPQIMQLDLTFGLGPHTFLLRDESCTLTLAGSHPIKRYPYFAALGRDVMENGARQMATHITLSRESGTPILLHEVIIDVRPRRIVFDMDKGNENVFRVVMQTLKNIGSQRNPCLAFWDAYDSSRNEKFSRHIISRSCVASCSEQACAYARALIATLPLEARDCLDGSLLRAKRVQNLRMCFCTKPDGRIKIPIEQECGENWSIERSFVQNSTECVTLPDILEHVERGIEDARAHLGVSMSSEQEKILLEWCTANAFVCKEIIGIGLIDLKRTGRSHCAICNADHDNRGSYAIVCKNALYVRCRRADDNNIEGMIEIWKRKDFREDFRDPHGDWSISDQDKTQRDLTQFGAADQFKKFAQRVLAFIRYVPIPYYLMRTKGSRGEIELIVTKTLAGRGEGKTIQKTLGNGDVIKVHITFETAIESIRECISYDGADFAPFFRDPPTINPRWINLWMGYTTEPLPHEDAINIDLVEPLIAHIREKWCRGNEALAEYVLNWFAYLLQDPGNPRRTALIVRGPQGCGKTSIVKYFGEQIIGIRYFCKCGIERISARFNTDLDMKTLVLIDEAIQSEMSQSALEAKLKDCITSDTIAIEPKGLAIENHRNCLHFIFGSNSDLPIRIEPAERRYCVLDCANVAQGERKTYFDNLFARLGTPLAVRNVFTFFARRDISRFNIEEIPTTTSLTQSKIDSLSYAQRFLYEMACGEIEGFNDPAIEYTVTSQDLYDTFTKWCALGGITRVSTKIVFGREISNYIGASHNMRSGTSVKKVYSMKITSLHEKFAQWIGATP